TPSTIDQAGKFVAPALHGAWQAPIRASAPEAVLLVGNNPLISHSGQTGHPGDVVDDCRNGHLIVVDPRRTEIAKRADVFLQPRPGTDAAVLAGMLRVILDEHLYDEEFVADNVDGLEDLRRVVDPFTPAAVAAHADVDADDL